MQATAARSRVAESCGAKGPRDGASSRNTEDTPRAEATGVQGRTGPGNAFWVRFRPNVLIGTARSGSAAHTEVVSNNENPMSLSNVPSGDVLVSHPTAVREHEISIVPNAPHAMSPTHDAAVNDGRSEADAIGVDAWLTEDQTHVVKIASNRTPDK